MTRPTITRSATPGDAERPHASWRKGCSTSPVGYLEGIFVETEFRARGVGSGAFHAALGYEGVERIVCFRKKLPLVGEAA